MDTVDIIFSNDFFDDLCNPGLYFWQGRIINPDFFVILGQFHRYLRI